MTVPPRDAPWCFTCGGLGWLATGKGDGYHLYDPCPDCKGTGMHTPKEGTK